MSFISKFTRRDLGFAVLTGLITGTIAWQVFGYLRVAPIHFGPETVCLQSFPENCITTYAHTIPWTALIVLVPILWILGVMLGYFLGQWLDFFNQFGKFAAIGFTNAAVTFGALNILISQTGYTSGMGYSVISGASFIVGVISSYIWNKYWAFRSEAGLARRSSRSEGGGQEFAKFFLVTVIAFIVNVVVASFVVNYTHPLAGMNAHTWANIAAVVGSALGLIFSFVGFRLAVFK